MKPDPSNDERFEQLCALAAIGEVSAAEFAELNEHLATAATARNCTRIFAALLPTNWAQSRPDAGARAIPPRISMSSSCWAACWSGRKRKQELPTRRNPGQLHEPRRRAPLLGLWSLLRSPILATAALIVVMCSAVGVAAYRYRDQTTRAHGRSAQLRVESTRQ